MTNGQSHVYTTADVPVKVLKPIGEKTISTLKSVLLYYIILIMQPCR